MITPCTTPELATQERMPLTRIYEGAVVRGLETRPASRHRS
jgi:hypothetical protein